MTINVSYFLDWIPADKVVQVLRRDPHTGQETLLRTVNSAKLVLQDVIFTGADLVIRELEKPADDQQ